MIKGTGFRWELLLIAPLLVGGCQVIPNDDPERIRELTVLYTNDEHGYMEGMVPGAGAANLLSLWKTREGYDSAGPYLVLSGGDNWTGPAISTWVQGQSMVEVMNAIGYDASAVGNHEFDFGLEILRRRTTQAGFPYLSANTVWRENGRVPVELGILPYTIKEVNGLRVGIVGLTTTSTPSTVNPQYVARLRFEEYEKALRATVPEVRRQNPDLVFVVAHVCLGALEPLAAAVADLKIDLMGAGHCNELAAGKVSNTVLVGGGYHFTAYASVTFRYDLGSDQLVGVNFHTGHNQETDPDPAVAAIVDSWQDQFKDVLGEVVAWSEAEIDHRTDAFRQALIDSWLSADASADIAITNAGGLRTPLPAGAITFNDLVNTMPFENNIIAVKVPGRVVLEAIEVGRRPVIAGIARHLDRWVLTRTGESIDPGAQYRVLINSFMYAGGDNFQIFSETDANGYDTGVHYRQPFVDLLVSLRTSTTNPLRLERLIQTRAP